MKEQKVATLTQMECYEIIDLNNKKDTLNEFFMTLTRSSLSTEDKEVMYKRLCKDMEESKKNIVYWWKKIVSKYNLEPKEGYQWKIDHESHELFILPMSEDTKLNKSY